MLKDLTLNWTQWETQTTTVINIVNDEILTQANNNPYSLFGEKAKNNGLTVIVGDVRRPHAKNSKNITTVAW